MKKISYSVKKQARRAGALARFKIIPNQDAGYEARKQQELAALRLALGVTA